MVGEARGRDGNMRSPRKNHPVSNKGCPDARLCGSHGGDGCARTMTAASALENPRGGKTGFSKKLDSRGESHCRLSSRGRELVSRGRVQKSSRALLRGEGITPSLRARSRSKRSGSTHTSLTDTRVQEGLGYHDSDGGSLRSFKGAQTRRAPGLTK